MIYDNERISRAIDRVAITGAMAERDVAWCVPESEVFDLLEKMRDEYEGIIKLLKEEESSGKSDRD